MGTLAIGYDTLPSWCNPPELSISLILVLLLILIIIIILIFFFFFAINQNFIHRFKKKIDYLQIQEYEILKYIPYVHFSCLRKRIVVK